MNYMCLIYQDEGRMDALPAAEWNALIAEHRAFDATLEQSGHYLVEAKDLDEATAIAARIPGARIGSIEVRPILPTK